MSLNGAPTLTTSAPPPTGWMALGQLTEERIRALSGEEARLLLLLGFRGRFDGHVPKRFTHREAAEALDRGERTVQRAAAGLRDKGHLTIRQRQDGLDIHLTHYPFHQGRVASTGDPCQRRVAAPGESPDAPQPKPEPGVPLQATQGRLEGRVAIHIEDSFKEGGVKTLTVDQAQPSAPPQIEIFDRVFAPVRDQKPLESYRWSCITSAVQLNDRCLAGWTQACERWRDNGHSPEKVNTLVQSYKEHFQPKVGPGSPHAAAAVPPEAPPEAEPRAPVRIIAPAAIRDALRHRTGPLKATLDALLAGSSASGTEAAS